MKNNKRGISAIVATVLIILITVAAVTIIWAAIIPMINNQLSKGTICLDAVSQVSLSDVGYTCKKVSGTDDGNVSLQIRHGAQNFALGDVQVIVADDQGNSKSFLLSNTSLYKVPASPFPDADGDGKVDFPKSNEEKVYVISAGLPSSQIQSVDIAPIVTIGAAKETCEISSSRTLPDCIA